MAGSKPYKPTKRRLRRSRRDGKVLKSKLLSEAVVLTCMGLFSLQSAGFFWIRERILLEYILLSGFSQPGLCLRLAFQSFVWAVGICLAVGGGLGFLIELFQVGVQFEPHILAPKASRLSIPQGIKRIASGLKNGWQPLLRFTLLVFIFWRFFIRFSGTGVGLLSAPLELKLAAVEHEVFWLLALAGAGMLAGGLLDYGIKYREYYRDLGMSHDEVKRERREDEGDPLLRATRKNLHAQLLRQDLIDRVRRSKVIVVRTKKFVPGSAQT